MKIVYDIDVEDGKSEIIEMLEAAVAASSVMLIPGKFVVDLLPFLRYAPAWFPGSGRQKFITHTKKLFRMVENVPYEDVVVSPLLAL